MQFFSISCGYFFQNSDGFQTLSWRLPKDKSRIKLSGLDFNTKPVQARTEKPWQKKKKRGQPPTRVLRDPCGRLRQNQLVPAVKMSLFFPSALGAGHSTDVCGAKFPCAVLGRAFQITRTEAEGGDPNYIKFVTTSLSSNRARAEKSLWQQCNLRIQTNDGRSEHIWFHLGARVAFSRRFIIYFHEVLAR